MAPLETALSSFARTSWIRVALPLAAAQSPRARDNNEGVAALCKAGRVKFSEREAFPPSSRESPSCNACFTRDMAFLARLFQRNDTEGDNAGVFA